MGQIVKQVSEHTTVYYWYPGDKREWARAGLAVGVGAAGFAVVTLLGAAVLTAVVFGTSVTAALTGLNFGRRDARALAGFPDLGHRGARRGARRAAVEHTGRAAWRAMAQGFGGAAAAVLIINLPAGGFAADWFFPVVPAVVGELAHQEGMLYERLRVSASAPGPAKAPSL